MNLPVPSDPNRSDVIKGQEPVTPFVRDAVRRLPLAKLTRDQTLNALGDLCALLFGGLFVTAGQATPVTALVCAGFVFGFWVWCGLRFSSSKR